MNKHASNVQMMPRSPSLTASVATQFLALVLVFFAVGTAAYVQLVNLGVIYSWWPTATCCRARLPICGLPSPPSGMT
jgi:hypothetical protein